MAWCSCWWTRAQRAATLVVDAGMMAELSQDSVEVCGCVCRDVLTVTHENQRCRPNHSWDEPTSRVEFNILSVEFSI